MRYFVSYVVIPMIFDRVLHYNLLSKLDYPPYRHSLQFHMEDNKPLPQSFFSILSAFLAIIQNLF